MSHGGVNYGPGDLKVDMMLKDEHRAAYEAMLADPGVSRTRLLAWLRELGYDVGIAAVGSHLRDFRDRQKSCRASGELSRMIVDEVRVFGEGVLAEATLTRAEQLLMQQMVRMSDQADLTPGEWSEWQKVIAAGVANRRGMQNSMRELEEMRRTAATEARKLARSGASGRDVANRVREILGIPLTDDNEDPRDPGTPAAGGVEEGDDPGPQAAAPSTDN